MATIATLKSLDWISLGALNYKFQNPWYIPAVLQTIAKKPKETNNVTAGKGRKNGMRLMWVIQINKNQIGHLPLNTKWSSFTYITNSFAGKETETIFFYYCDLVNY